MGYVRVATQGAQGWFPVPFQCGQCGLSTQANTFAASSATTALEHHRLEELAHAAAYQAAYRTASEVPCPRCGGPSTAFLERHRAWEQKATGRKRLRLVLGIVGAVLVLGSGGGCASLYDSVSKAAPGVAIWVGFWSVVVFGIVALLSPGKAPMRGPPSPNVRFE